MNRERRRIVLWLLACLLLGLATASRVHFDVEVLNLLPQDIPAVQGLKLHQRYFANANELMVTLESPDPGTAEEAARTLAAALSAEPRQVRSAVWRAPWEEHPEHMAELLALLWLNQPAAALQQLHERLSAPEAILANTRERLTTALSPEDIARLSYDPYGFSDLPPISDSPTRAGQDGTLFASDDGRFRVIYVEAAVPLGTYRDCAAWLTQIRQIIQQWRASNPPQTRVALTGRPAYLAEVATDMERDMTGSVAGTAVVIAALFGIAYRKLQPLLWLLALLALTLVLTVGMAGLLWGQLNIISFGFAAIVLGLVADYGVVLYEEMRSCPDAGWRPARAAVWRGIAGGAATTACGFFALSLEAIPGLQQLGVLVTAGTLIGAGLMLTAYLPLLSKPAAERAVHAPVATGTQPLATSSPQIPVGAASPTPAQTVGAARRVAWAGTAALVCVAVWLGFTGLPPVNHGSDPLRPLESEAYQAGERLAEKLGTGRNPWWILLHGSTESALAEKLRGVRQAFQPHSTTLQLLLPDSLWPDPAAQIANREPVAAIVRQAPGLRAAALGMGFTTNALSLMNTVLDHWQSATGKTFWPTHPSSQWTLNRFSCRTPDGYLAMGMVRPRSTGEFNESELTRLGAALGTNGVWLASWGALGTAVFDRVTTRLVPLVTVLCFVLTAALWLTLGRFREVLLNILSLVAVGVALLGWMRLSGSSWNLMNLVGLPLLLGAGVDYAIHMQLALRRHQGDIRSALRSTGRALFLCAATTVVGFGSLASSSSAGLASLGITCAIGIGMAWTVSVFLLPAWWLAWERLGTVPPAPAATPNPQQPSGLYRAGGWWTAKWIVRCLPQRLTRLLFSAGALLYCAMFRRRHAVVTSNLLPVVGRNPTAAARCARRLHAEFGRKLADLLRYETGHIPDAWFASFTGWDTLSAARAQRQGILIVTAHLGNWELGAPLLVSRGIPLLVLSQPEPDPGLGAQREQARTAQGVRTVVVGTDPFAILPAIQHLQDGGAVALLIDRPSSNASVTVELFNRPFRASLAAAELARASGCAIVPVAIVRGRGGYDVVVRERIDYDRARLRDPAARRELTQEILRALEPLIRQHPEQWFHFIPIWPDPAAESSAVSASSS